MTSFCSLKLCIKYKLIDHIINNIRLIQNLTCILRVKERAIEQLDFQNM